MPGEPDSNAAEAAERPRRSPREIIEALDVPDRVKRRLLFDIEEWERYGNDD